MTAIVYVAAAVGTLAIVWTVYRNLAPDEAHDLPTRLDRDVDGGGQSPQVAKAERALRPEVLAAHLGAPVTEGNCVELLENGVEIFPAMLGAIDEARETVNFLTFVYWEGDIADQFAEALARAARRGVEVRVLLDAHGSLRMRDGLTDELRDAGCRVEAFHPFEADKLHQYNNRTHRKVLVVDGRVGFTGGVGIAEEWTGNAEDMDHRRDNHFRVTGPVVRYLQGAFAENWREASNEVLARELMFPPLESPGSMTVVPFHSSPGGSVSPVAFSYWYALRSARKRVWITTPYFVPTGDLVDEIENAAARGVDIALITPGRNNDYEAIRRASETFYERLLDAGVRLYSYDPTMVHVKLMVIDGECAVVGSSNFDNRSFELNYEMCLAVFDEPFCAELEASFRRDLERSSAITMEFVESMSLPRRLTNAAALALKPQI